MSKKIVRYKGSRAANYYDLAGFMNSMAPKIEDGKIASGLGEGLTTGSAQMLGALGSGIGAFASPAISGGLSSAAGDTISGIGSTIGGAISAVNPLLGGAVSLGTNLIGGVTNKLFGSKMNKAKIAEIEASNAALANTQVDASSNASILNQWAGQDWGASFTKGDIGKDGLFSSKAKRKFRELQRQQQIARDKAYNSYDNAIESADATQDALLQQGFFAHGGPLFTNGAEWSNGLMFINNGGPHEENPNEGVQVGVDQQGVPNLVEEGEVIWNDYVFSNRLQVPKAVKSKYRLRGKKGLTFADAVKQVQKESEERPNDPISKRGLLSSMSRLQQAQETVRQQNQVGQEGVQYAHGGRMGTLFDGLSDMPNFLDSVDYGDWQDYGTLLEPINAEDLWNESMAGTDGGNTDNGSKLTWLRYAPVIGNAIGLAHNIFADPDYSSADTMLNEATRAGNIKPVGYSPVGNYMTYKPFDRNFYTNKLNAEAGATRRALLNSSSPSRNAALLAADYNAQGKLGDLARQAEEYNLAQRQKVEEFNRATNMANAEMGLKAAMANQEAALKARSSRLSGVAQAIAMRDAIDARRGASMSANLTNLFDSLGNIGIDEMNRADRDMLIRAGVFGTLSEKPQGWSNKRWEDYKKAISGKGYSKGGKLKKRRGGLTY